MNFFYFVRTKLTRGKILSLVASLLFALFIRCAFKHFYGVSLLLEEGITLNATYLAIIFLFRFFFTTYLEFKLGDSFHESLFVNKSQMELFMDNTSNNSTMAGSNRGSASAQQTTSTVGGNTSAENWDNKRVLVKMGNLTVNINRGIKHLEVNGWSKEKLLNTRAYLEEYTRLAKLSDLRKKTAEFFRDQRLDKILD